jgi:hypothetical protein
MFFPSFLLMLMTPFYVCKVIEIQQQKKHLITSLTFMLIFSKLDKVYSDFKDQALKFSNKFDVEIVFNFGIIKINNELLFIKSIIKNQIFYFKILAIFLLFTIFP